MGNKYTTSTKVKDELPGSLPASLTDPKIDGYIEDASRYIDARLPNYAGFSDIGGSPSTPRLIEKISSYLSAYDCLVYMGEMRGFSTAGSELRDIAELLLDNLYPRDGSPPKAMIPPDEYNPPVGVGDAIGYMMSILEREGYSGWSVRVINSGGGLCVHKTKQLWIDESHAEDICYLLHEVVHIDHPNHEVHWGDRFTALLTKYATPLIDSASVRKGL